MSMKHIQLQSGQSVPKFFQQFVTEVLNATIFEKNDHKGLTVYIAVTIAWGACAELSTIPYSIVSADVSIEILREALPVKL